MANGPVLFCLRWLKTVPHPIAATAAGLGHVQSPNTAIISVSQSHASKPSYEYRVRHLFPVPAQNMFLLFNKELLIHVFGIGTCFRTRTKNDHDHLGLSS